MSRLHQLRKTDLSKVKWLGENDYIDIWQKPQRAKWMSQQLYDSLPDKMEIRVVTFSVKSKDQKEQHSWPMLLQKYLPQDFCEVVNLGDGSSKPSRYLQILAHVGVPLRATHAIVCLNSGDLAYGTPVLRKASSEQLFLRYDGHPTARAYELVAEFIAEQMSKELSASLRPSIRD